MGSVLKAGQQLANPASLLGLPDPVGDALGINDEEKKKQRPQQSAATKSLLSAQGSTPSNLTKLV
jgi:hypothetical protein